MIAWPDDLRPERAAIHVHNELETELAPSLIWPWLVRATRWGELYSNRLEGLVHAARSGHPDTCARPSEKIS